MAAYSGTGGYRTLGIEPALNLVEKANARGLEVIPNYFNLNSAAQARERMGNPSIILARHCFAHMHDWKEFMAGLEILADKHTVIAIEIPYVHDTLNKTEFDQIYHEHASFISITALTHLLMSSPFDIHRVIRYGIHGGSLLVMLRSSNCGIHRHLSVDEYLAEDQVTEAHWQKFTVNANMKINKLRDLIRGNTHDGKIACFFGASAKATVWINACGFTKNEISFVSDNSPFKPGNLVPGTSIPVIPQDEFFGERPHVAFMSAWNFKDEVLKSQKRWTDKGGRFLIPTVDGIECI
jgi:novobiocin biosynthesis protein NovU/D-mycarose 3-C-methyltransferase